MLVDYLDTKKKITIEPSTGVKKFVAPNMRPLDIIVLGTKQAISTFKGEPTYLFYETLKGFNFRTLTSLYDEPSLLEYVPFEPGTNIIPDGQRGAGAVDVHKEMRNVLNYEIVSNNDYIVNYRTGMLGSRLITHDIVSKSYETEVYNYFDNFPNESHIVSGVTTGIEENIYILINDIYNAIMNFNIIIRFHINTLIIKINIICMIWQQQHGKKFNNKLH